MTDFSILRRLSITEFQTMRKLVEMDAESIRQLITATEAALDLLRTAETLAENKEQQINAEIYGVLSAGDSGEVLEVLRVAMESMRGGAQNV